LTNSLKCTVGTGATVGSGDQLYITQNVEANQITAAGFGTSTPQNLCLSFWIKSSIGSYTMAATIHNAANTRSYVVPLTIPSAATWTPETACLPADGAGSWVTSGTAQGLHVAFFAAAGSALQGSGNAWQAANVDATTAITNTILSTTGASFQVTGVKLEISPIPTPYVRRDFATELALCQRYYQKSYALGAGIGSTGDGGGLGTTVYASIPNGNAVNFLVPFPVQMRVAPTVTFYSPSAGTAGKVDVNGAASTAAAVTVSATKIGGIVNNSGGTWTANFNVGLEYVADARL
jgi:hypothetical protein